MTIGRILPPLAAAFHSLTASTAWFFTNDAVARWTALALWSAITVMLSVAAWRRLFGRPIYIDDLLFAAWLLTLNRVCFSLQALFPNELLADVTRWFAIGAGLFYAYVVSSYIWPASVPGLRRA